MALLKIKDRAVLDTFFGGYVEKSAVNTQIELGELENNLKISKLHNKANLLKEINKYGEAKAKFSIDDALLKEVEEIMAD